MNGVYEGTTQATAGRNGWGEEIGATLRLALPLVLLQLGHVGIQTTDVLMIGRLGPEPLAAASLAVHWFILPWLFCLGILTAVPVLAAQALGARDRRGVRRSVRQGLWLAITLSLPAMLLLWHTPTVLSLAGQEPALVEAASAYMRTLLWGFMPSMGFLVLRGFVSALSRPGPATAVMLLGVALNVVLNYGLIFGNFGLPRLELVGAGIGSAVVHTAMFAGLLAFVLTDRRFRRYYLLARFARADWPRFFALLRLGWPVGFVLLFEVGLFTTGTLMMGWVGPIALAANAIALQCANITFMVPLGISQAAAVRVGLAAGGRDEEGVKLAGWSGIALGVGFMSLSALAFWLLPETIVGLFLDVTEPGSQEVLAIGVGFLAVAAVFQILDGAQVIAGSLLRGLSDTRVPMVYTAIGYWGIGFTCSYLLAFTFDLGGIGIWIGWAAGLLASALLLVWRFANRDRLALLQRVHQT